MNQMWVLLLLLVVCESLLPKTHALFKLEMKTLELCDPNTNYPIKSYVTFRTYKNAQYLDANATLTVAFDDNLQTNFTAELLVGKKYRHLVLIEEHRACTSMHRYVGELIYDLERTAQLVPGLCPVPIGRYHIHNYLLNFNQVTLQAFPFGHLRLTLNVFDKKKSGITCLRAEAENIP